MGVDNARQGSILNDELSNAVPPASSTAGTRALKWFRSLPASGKDGDGVPGEITNGKFSGAEVNPQGENRSVAMISSSQNRVIAFPWGSCRDSWSLQVNSLKSITIS
ncbi:hypothetical protein [Mesorhizobium sp. M0276]|uniref:hypothetical protein n=1 Tax=Mesorhizobium sp. M0276 TaxID=2956928 RepID=UPI00333AD52F